MPEIEPPKLENMERKLQILPNEWYKESYYMSDEVAAAYAQFQPTEGPFIIVPSFAKLGFQSDFVLTSKFPFYSYSLLVEPCRSAATRRSQKRCRFRQMDGEVCWRLPPERQGV